MRSRTKALYGAAVLSAALLAACGGTGDGGGGVSLDGLAATGAAMSSAAVSVKCNFGAGTATTGTDGSFSILIPPPATAPCLIQVTKGSTTIYGMANEAGRVNVTPITDLMVAKASGGDPGAAFANFDIGRAATIRSNLDAARTYVQEQVAGLAGGAITGDPLTKRFVIGDADDKLLDNLAAALTTAGKSLGDLRTAAAGGTDLRAALPPEETRPHDTAAYALNATDAAATTFAAMAAASGDKVDMSTTSRWAGVLGGAGYRVEVPPNWNGELVMYTHGYAGEGLVLASVTSSIRRFLIQQGYAWAASSYSKNSYDVRAGIEDTNKLALNFNSIASARGRALDKPSRMWIIGHSMGGHIAAAAVEAETYATSVNKVKYDGSMPMCGVVGDTTLFDTFAGMQAAAHVLSGNAAVALDQWATIKTQATTALFGTTLGTSQTVPNGTAGQQYMSVLQNLTGGPRPLFDVGYTYGGSFAGGPYGVFGTTTVTTGLTTKPTADTSAIVYKVDSDPTTSATLNSTAPKAAAPPDANRLRRDGLRWIPKVNGQPQSPVLTMHTLGDLFVPFSMEQVYRQRLTATGFGDKVVQRAIRGATHCDFTNAEMSKGFSDLVAWVKAGTKPAGDDVTTPATIAATKYGCTFTNDTVDADDSNSTKQLRGLITQLGKSCTAQNNNNL
jgi:pimeloyl-ACP methyl ester carboxylesterase